MRSCGSHVTRQCGGGMALCNSDRVVLKLKQSAVHSCGPSALPLKTAVHLWGGGEGRGGRTEPGIQCGGVQQISSDLNKHISSYSGFTCRSSFTNLRIWD